MNGVPAGRVSPEFDTFHPINVEPDLVHVLVAGVNNVLNVTLVPAGGVPVAPLPHAYVTLYVNGEHDDVHAVPVHVAVGVP